ncbi:MAG: FAD-dependent thymidylate synthase [Chloroflexi bacterium]|nr:FAD-dependent thymidylate synthase [Chloroflexota bacterium]
MPSSPSELHGKRFPVLDKGYVILLEHMGSDERVVDAARVSTGSKTGVDPERDRSLIFFLMENKHGTPFEHVVFQFAIKCPLFVARQWMRHRIASYNERSARYRVFEEEFYIPRRADIPPIFSEADLKEYEDVLKHEHEVYQRLVQKAQPYKEHRQRAREVLRALLGTAYYTEFYWTINFRSLMNFMDLRTGTGAQWEIKQYAAVIADIARQVVPLCYAAYERYVLKKPAAGDLEAGLR